MVPHSFDGNSQLNHPFRQRFTSQDRQGDIVTRKYAAGADQVAADAIAEFEQWQAAGRPLQSAQTIRLSRTQVAQLIDHTQLKPEAGENAIRELCLEAEEYGFASVCVHSSWASTCAAFLADSSVDVCAVAGFPQGTNITSAKVFEAQAAIDAGASEIDMVLHIGKLKDGDYAYVAEDVGAVAEACHAKGALLKVIIEACLLSDTEKAAACALAKYAGADFVKTSTGFNGPGANVDDVALMRHVVGPDLGVKAAGGVRTYDDLAAMVQAGATRVGASAGVQIVAGAEE